MPGDLKEELAVAPPVCELTLGRRAKWKPTKHEGPGIEGELLISVLAFLADEGNSFELSEPELCDAE